MPSAGWGQRVARLNHASVLVPRSLLSGARLARDCWRRRLVRAISGCTWAPVALEVDSIHVLGNCAWTFTRVTKVSCHFIALKLRILSDKNIGLCSAP